MPPLLQSDIPGVPCRRGKVRDVYDLGDRLVLVATDRISAFDYVLPTPIPDKGRVLTALTLFWLDYLGAPNHLLGTDPMAMGPAFAARAADLAGRTCLVKKAKVAPIECVVRGYLAGSGWKEYAAAGAVLWDQPAAEAAAGGETARTDFHPCHQGGEWTRPEHLLRANDGADRSRTGRGSPSPQP